jgi:hypothetical protein
MITISLVHKEQSQQEFDEFLTSLSYSNSGENKYEVISEKDSPVFAEKGIERVSLSSPDSRIYIVLPTDCLVLCNSWDKYIVHALNDGLPQGGFGKNYVPSWEGYVQRRMGLTNRRPPEGLFPDLKVILATK